ncbi:MAG TPA: hypothetical protein VFV92_06010 [Candidatus Bathyarchaeia archaeon]|nr:hypothetical protein [Candidatus Bathyarchaeia archaeon]
MWETIAIIASLGGLEFILWVLNRRAARLDREMQRKQMEILDGILTELAILNSEDTTNTGRREPVGEVEHEGTGQQAENRSQEHPVCN